MLLDETPNTLAYMIAGYAVFFTLPILTAAGWLIRQRNLEKELDLMQLLAQDQGRTTKDKDKAEKPRLR